jgi:hypothetical protein
MRGVIGRASQSWCNQFCGQTLTEPIGDSVTSNQHGELPMAGLRRVRGFARIGRVRGRRRHDAFQRTVLGLGRIGFVDSLDDASTRQW